MTMAYIDDLFMLQVRMFRLAQIRWNMSAEECISIFAIYDVNKYIESCFEEYHVQGDETNISDIENYLVKKGCCYMRENIDNLRGDKDGD